MAAHAEKAASKLDSAVIRTAPLRMILLNYDKALSNLNKAIEAIAEDNIEARCNHVNEAIEALSELYLTLDHDSNEQLVDNLRRIYTYLIWKLPEVNFDNNAAVASEGIAMLKELRRSWAKAESMQRYAQEIKAQNEALKAQEKLSSPKRSRKSAHQVA